MNTPEKGGREEERLGGGVNGGLEREGGKRKITERKEEGENTFEGDEEDE